MKGLDVVFLDPPYGLGLIPPILNALPSCTGLDAEGVIVAETAARETLPLNDATLQLLTKRRYGDTSIHIIAWNHELRATGKAKPEPRETIPKEKST
jgi:16S rRNA (guanine966-N2)-methyltransferase